MCHPLLRSGNTPFSGQCLSPLQQPTASPPSNSATPGYSPEQSLGKQGGNCSPVQSGQPGQVCLQQTGSSGERAWPGFSVWTSLGAVAAQAWCRDPGHMGVLWEGAGLGTGCSVPPKQQQPCVKVLACKE